MEDLLHIVDVLLGINDQPKRLTLAQICLRSALIYIGGWLMLRVGEHRFLGKNTAFDVVLGFIFGSLLSRAITARAHSSRRSWRGSSCFSFMRCS